MRLPTWSMPVSVRNHFIALDRTSGGEKMTSEWLDAVGGCRQAAPGRKPTTGTGNRSSCTFG